MIWGFFIFIINYLNTSAGKQTSSRVNSSLYRGLFVWWQSGFPLSWPGWEAFLSSRHLRLHFLQQVPSVCTGRESSEQFAGGQKILRHSTTPFCQKKKKKIIISFLFHQRTQRGRKGPAPCAPSFSGSAQKSTVNTQCDAANAPLTGIVGICISSSDTPTDPLCSPALLMQSKNWKPSYSRIENKL